MYIGTDLIIKQSDKLKGIDKLNFSLSISEKSIPFSLKYGLDINESVSNISEVLRDKIRHLIEKLDGVTYSDFNIDTLNKIITLKVYCGGELISQTISI